MPDDLTAYLKSIAEYDPFDKEEVLRLATLKESGDAYAKELLIRHNLKFVVVVAKRYKNVKGANMLDMIQDGNIGLMKAVDKFDPKRGCCFSTYAAAWIRQSIQKGLAASCHTISIPANLNDQINLINRTKIQLTNEIEREPTLAELSDKLNIPITKLKQILDFVPDIDSLDRFISNEENVVVGDLVSDNENSNPDTISIKNSLERAVNECMDVLTERERNIIEMRFGFNGKNKSSLESIGKEYNITRERVRQIEQKALEKLKNKAKAKQMMDFLQT
jgi:RNA polymerase primary sigma factor